MNLGRVFTPLSFVAAAALAAVGCDTTTEQEQPEVVQTGIALTAFDTCSELETYLENSAIQEINVHLDSLKDGRWYGWGPFVLEGDANQATPPRANNAEDAGGSDAPTDYTRTNTQVEGVDEADFVKTNGTHIFVLSGQKLYMAQSWPADEMTLVDSMELEGYPSEMFLDEDGNVVVFSYYSPDHDADSMYYCQWGCWRGMTKVTVIGTEGESLAVRHQIYLAGSYISGRRIGSSVRVVMRDYLPLPETVRWYPESFNADPQRDPEAWAAAIEALKRANAQVIRNQTLDDWLPESFYVDGTGRRIDLPRRCSDFARANAPVKLGVASIGTINLGQNGVSLSTTSILGEVGHVYASPSSLYIANPHWWWWPTDDETTYTYLHKFDISEPDRAVYRASGVVEGYPLNQFAMDEHKGNFRVATTVDRWIHRGGDRWNFDIVTTNRVTVLGERNGALKMLGRTQDLAENERIQSARFMGDKGYLVTFEQIDPLFTLDLSDPKRPQVMGELKIPGFSSYLHPLGEDHLLAIGVDLPEPGPDGRVDWSQRAMKLTIFDVSDLTDPVEAHTRTIGTAYGWSEAAWSHKAFNYFAARKMLAIPFSDYMPGTDGDAYWDHFVSDLRLFRIDLDDGITPAGSIGMHDIYRTYRYDRWTWRWSPWVRRSVMADDFAYAISDAGIRAIDMRTPEQTVSTVLFDDALSRHE